MKMVGDYEEIRRAFLVEGLNILLPRGETPGKSTLKNP
jgi:hypothetical protein